MEELNDRQGVWAQGDCVFFEDMNEFEAISDYRQKLCLSVIAINTRKPDGIRVKELLKEIKELKAELERKRQGNNE